MSEQMPALMRNLLVLPSGYSTQPVLARTMTTAP